jgi:Flp pilus assembly protein TadG
MTLRTRTRIRRRGAATVEFAVVAVVLAGLIAGAIELTRVIQVKSYLADAVRSGGRQAAQPGATSAQVSSAVGTILANDGLAGTPTVTVLVNGVAADASTALRGDKITLTVSIPVGDSTWITPSYFTKTSTLSETLIVMHH